MTAHVEVHPHAAATTTSLRQDIGGRPSSTSRPVARSNYGYIDDDDDDLEDNVPERRRDWPTAPQTRLDFTRPVPGNDLEDMTSSPPSYAYLNVTVADPYRRPPNTNEGLSVISSNLSGSAQTNYNRGGIGVYPANVNVSLNDTDV